MAVHTCSIAARSESRRLLRIWLMNSPSVITALPVTCVALTLHECSLQHLQCTASDAFNITAATPYTATAASEPNERSAAVKFSDESIPNCREHSSRMSEVRAGVRACAPVTHGCEKVENALRVERRDREELVHLSHVPQQQMY